MKPNSLFILGTLLALAGCATGKSQLAADLNVTLDVAAAAEGAYAARPGADPKTVVQLSRLLSVAQAAVTAWQASAQPEDRAVASGAIAALVEYEASAGATQ